MPTLLAYAMLFTGIAVFFIFIHLLIGKFVRPNRPDDEKKTIYECGEPTIGSSWVQFDLRFYVVALLFVIFDVEMAFFFPWAVVFGSANELSKPDLTTEQRQAVIASASPHLMADRTKMESGIGTLEARLTVLRAQHETASDPAERDRKMSEITESENLMRGIQAQINRIDRLATDGESASKTSATFASIVFVDLLIFFGVLLVGFAYLWRRGDLDWVRSVASQKLAG